MANTLMAKAAQEFHIPATSGKRTAVDYLSEASGLSRQKIKQAMQKGCVWLEHVKAGGSKSDVEGVEEKDLSNQATYIQRLRRAKKILDENDILHFYYDESVLDCEIPTAELIEDFGAYSIWNKPSGMLSQGSKWGDHSTIYRWAEKQLQPERPAFIVHRLDRAARGLIILAHKKSVASQFSRIFEQRLIEKQYQVKVEGDFSKHVNAEDNSLTIDDKLDNKIAVSYAKMLSYNADDNTSTLQVKIETGRKHQIRKHLSGIGFPVVGDRLYGSAKEDGEAQVLDLQLQAKHLEFICPITSEKRSFSLKS